MYNFILPDSGLDAATGTYKKSKGGTENTYNALLARLDEETKNKFQFICSRVRELDADKKRILWLHDYWNDPENEHLKDPASIDRFDKLVFVSNQQFHTYHQAYNIPYGKSAVLHNAIEPIPFKDKWTDDTIRIIYHTTPHRGLEILVPVFEHLAQIHPNIHLDVFSSFEIYGWPQRDKPYEAVFETCRNHQQITYHGFQPNEVVREALQKAHIFAFPSIWPETSCIAGIEAAAAGCAVVCPDYAALSETMLGSAYMYRYDEHVQSHANKFAVVLNAVINNVHNDEFKLRMERQSQLFNSAYSWDNRITQWNELLASI